MMRPLFKITLYITVTKKATNANITVLLFYIKQYNICNRTVKSQDFVNHVRIYFIRINTINHYKPMYIYLEILWLKYIITRIHSCKLMHKRII